MNNWTPKTRWLTALAGTAFMLAMLVIFRPGIFTDVGYLGGLLFLECLAFAMWKYSRRFFPVLMLVFLLAGTDVPMQGTWGALRWLVLGTGALAGVVIYLKDHSASLQFYHWVAFSCVVTAAVSAEVSSFPKQPLLKSLSLFLLFLYGAFGARLALIERSEKFLLAVLWACEFLIYFSAVQYFVLHRAFFGNPNSLGIVMGVAALPLMLWGISISQTSWVRKRRTFSLLVAMALLLASYARASIVAAAMSCILFCVLTRRFRMLIAGGAIGILLAMGVAIVVPLPNSPDASTNLSSRFLFKGKDQAGALSSRTSVWDTTIASIRQHPWFGTGFGTALSNYDSSINQVGNFGSNAATTREHGNSYLAIVEGVGLLGVLPFAVLLIMTVTNISRVLKYFRFSKDIFSPAVPLTFVLIAGLVHAMFEDWLFAVGYYTCVFFWTFGFMLVDIVPRAARHSASPEASNPGLQQPALVPQSF